MVSDQVDCVGSAFLTCVGRLLGAQDVGRRFVHGEHGRTWGVWNQAIKSLRGCATPGHPKMGVGHLVELVTSHMKPSEQARKASM